MSDSRPVPRWQIALVLVVTAACLVWVLWGLELEGLERALGEMKWARLPLVAAALTLNHLLRVWRFQLLVGDGLSYGRSLAVCSVGYLAVNVLPLRLGEFVRPYLLLMDEVPVGRSMAAVVVERMLDLSMMLGLMFIVVLLPLPENIEVDGVDLVGAGQKFVGGLLLVAVVGLAALYVVSDRIAPWLPGPLADGLASLSEALGELAGSPWRAAVLLGQSVLVWGSTVVYVWTALACFPSLPTDPVVAIVVWTAIVVGILILPTPGFLGAYEAFGLAALMLWEVDEQTARTFTLFLHLAVFAAMGVFGTVFMLREGWSLAAVVRESRAVVGGADEE